jgi:hypothetical protein
MCKWMLLGDECGDMALLIPMRREGNPTSADV